MSESALRVATVIRRHAYVLWRAPHRWFDIVFWPLMDVILWGSLGGFVASENDTSRASAPYLLTGIILFHVLYQVQIAVATGFMEETWSRNLLNIMTTPVTELEYTLGIAAFGLVKLVLAIGTLSIAAFGFFSFDLGEVGWSLIPIVSVLVLNGWAISLFVIGLMLRFGQSAEILAWGLTFVLMSVSGVYYPVDALPGPLQPLARAFPTTGAFEEARHVLDGRSLDWGRMGTAALGTAVLAAVAVAFVVRMLRTFRTRGYVTRFS